MWKASLPGRGLLHCPFYRSSGVGPRHPLAILTHSCAGSLSQGHTEFNDNTRIGAGGRGGADAQKPGEGRGTCRSSAARESGLLKQPQGLLHHLLCSPPRLSQKHLVLVLLELAYRLLEMMVPGGEGRPQTSLMSLHPVSAGDTAGIPGTLAQAAAHEAQATRLDTEKKPLTLSAGVCGQAQEAMALDHGCPASTLGERRPGPFSSAPCEASEVMLAEYSPSQSGQRP